MESGILMIVIVVIGVFYPVYTAWISLVAAPVYLKIGFLFAMAGALLVMRILRKEKQIKWIVLIGILGAYAWSLYSWYDEECHYQYARSVHGDSGNALMLFVGTFTCLIPLFLLDAELRLPTLPPESYGNFHDSRFYRPPPYKKSFSLSGLPE